MELVLFQEEEETGARSLLHEDTASRQQTPLRRLPDLKQLSDSSLAEPVATLLDVEEREPRQCNKCRLNLTPARDRFNVFLLFYLKNPHPRLCLYWF